MCGIVKLHPARGRKHTSHRHGQHRAKLQFIPARGRKPCCFLGGDFLFVHIAIYPREGAKTHFRYCSRLRNWQFQFLPARGRKPCFLLRCFFASDCNLSPQGDKKAPLHWRLPAAEVLCFFLYSILQVGNCACRNRLCDRQRLDALRDVPLQGADLMQVVGDLLQGLFNVLCIQRQNALALQA